MLDLTPFKKELYDLMKKAGRSILEVYEKDFEVQIKQDQSPVTIADKKADVILHFGLKKLFPNIPIISEENIDSHNLQNHETFFLVDPIDGTSQFIKKNGEFTINIGLIHKKKPCAGIIYVPTKKDMYFAPNPNKAYLNDKQIHTQSTNEKGLSIIAGYSTVDTPELAFFLEDKKVREIKVIGSSIKFCLIAAGIADMYPRIRRRIMEWDTAAGHAILKAAGGRVVDMDDNELTYGSKDLHVPFFVAKNQ